MMPAFLIRQHMDALNVWSKLDVYGRRFDTMSGNPMPLQLSVIDAECAKYDDPDALRRMVLIIEGHIYKVRVERKVKEQDKR